MSSLTDLYYYIKKYIEDYNAACDPRLAAYPLTSSIWPTFLICGIYLFVVRFGKRVMKDRPPINCQGILVMYNAFMVLLSAWIVLEMLTLMYLENYSLGCQPVNKSHSPNALRFVRVAWLFYFTKIIELTDTLFFIFRKKFELITFLHVFHHVSMPPSVWLGLQLAPGGFTAFYAMLNTLIHVFMYTYYGLAAAGPAFRRYIWWKKYMTYAQMIQFLLLMLHSQQLFFKPCDFPIGIAIAIFIYAAIFFILFSNYLFRTYYYHCCSGQGITRNKLKKKQDEISQKNISSTSTKDGSANMMNFILSDNISPSMSFKNK